MERALRFEDIPVGTGEEDTMLEKGEEADTVVSLYDEQSVSLFDKQ
jgi:hypothetical protein